MQSATSQRHPLAGLGARSLSLPELSIRADHEYADQTAYEADFELEDIQHTRSPSTRSLPPSLRDLAWSASAADDMAIHVDFTLARASTRSARSTYRQGRPSYSHRSPSAPTTVIYSESHLPPVTGLGLGLPTSFHLPIQQHPPTLFQTTTVVAGDFDNVDMQRSGSDRSLLTYSILPPGLSSPIPFGDESIIINESGLITPPLDEADITIDIVLPTPALPASGATEDPFDREMTPPGAPRLESISRFASDPLYG